MSCLVIAVREELCRGVLSSNRCEVHGCTFSLISGVTLESGSLTWHNARESPGNAAHFSLLAGIFSQAASHPCSRKEKRRHPRQKQKQKGEQKEKDQEKTPVLIETPETEKQRNSRQVNNNNRYHIEILIRNHTHNHIHMPAFTTIYQSLSRSTDSRYSPSLPLMTCATDPRFPIPQDL